MHHEKNESSNIYNELTKILTTVNEDDLSGILKNKARNIDIEGREKLENALLKLVSEPDNKEIKHILYDTLASLQSVWNEYTPKKNLIEKYRSAFRQNKYEEAGQICSELISQGLDYLGTVELGPGRFFPVDVEGHQYIIHHADNELRFLNVELELGEKIEIPADTKIIDILPPDKYEPDSESDIDKKLWLLKEKKDGKRTISSINLWEKRLDKDEIPVKADLNGANKLSRFRGHLLLVGGNFIFYYKKDSGWKEWFKIDVEITSIESTKENYWVGLADGTIRIHKSLEHVGVRGKIKPHPDSIGNIRASNYFVVISSNKAFSITEIGGIPLLELIKVDSRIIYSTIINNETAILLQANGMLVARAIKEDHKNWQINLLGEYNTIINIGSYIYCLKHNENVTTLKVPEIKKMSRSLGKKGERVAERPIERDVKAPVRHISEFVGREAILNKIKKDFNNHFLIYGAPKIGKTSILNVLRDFLSGDSACCHLDISEIAAVAHSGADFEKIFIDHCLEQHNLKRQDLKGSSPYLAFRSLVEKTRGSKRFCVFCMDNFQNIEKFEEENDNRLETFFKEMFIHSNVRIVATCGFKDKEKVWDYFRKIEKAASGNREIKEIQLSTFSEPEAIKAIRMLGNIKKDQVEEIYKYTGGFPHLIQLYRNWDKREKSLDDYSSEVVEDFCTTIFGFFRDLDEDASIFLASMLYKKSFSKTLWIKNLYHDFPLFRKLIPSDSLSDVLTKISSYCDELVVKPTKDKFSIKLKKEASLIQEAAKHIPWIKALMAMHRFSFEQTWNHADEIVTAFREIAKITPEKVKDMDEDKLYSDLIRKYRDDFYIRKLSEEGRKALRMPLVTFIVVSLTPWSKDRNIEKFRSLYNSIEDFVRKSKAIKGEKTASLMFYILLFVFHGLDFEEINEEMRGLERVSILDTFTMKRIILDREPGRKASEEIFGQLHISERSPYTMAGAVEELFFGREMEIALIRGLPENIGVFGTRTIGKTSLLLKLYRDIKELTNWRVYALDCAMIENEYDLLRNLAYKMGEDFNQIPDLEKFKKHIIQHAEEKDVQYLFLLDEVDGLVAYDTQNDERIFRTFNEMYNVRLETGVPAARFVLFGFQQMHEQMNDPRSRLYNFMVFLPMKSLDPDSAFSLVTSPMKDIHIKWQNEKKDASYLIDQCSGYPLLLQAACHTLLTILDGKKEHNDLIQRHDIDHVFTQPKFLQLCMRFFEPKIKKAQRSKGLLGRKSVKWEEEPFFEDIHKITILTHVKRYSEEGKESFTLPEILEELNKYRITFSPGLMRKIINRLSLNGTIRMIEEPTVIAKNETDIVSQVEKEKERGKLDEKKMKGLKVGKSDIFEEKSGSLPEFRYEFGIKIFPELLKNYFGGIDKCNEELEALVAKETWKDWIRRNA